MLLAFLLATHAYWCGCHTHTAPEIAVSATRAVAVMVVTHSHSVADVCAGVDETKNRATTASLVVAPTLIWIALVWVGAASVVVAPWQRAAVFPAIMRL